VFHDALAATSVTRGTDPGRTPGVGGLLDRSVRTTPGEWRETHQKARRRRDKNIAHSDRAARRDPQAWGIIYEMLGPGHVPRPEDMATELVARIRRGSR
jgi:hypothetical protein